MCLMAQKSEVKSTRVRLPVFQGKGGLAMGIESAEQQNAAASDR